MTPRIYAYLIIGGVVLANVFALKYLYDKNLTLRTENAQVTTERDLSKQAANRLDKLLAEKIKADAELTAKFERLRRSFNTEKRNDPALQEWAATPLPAGAIDFLYDYQPDDAGKPGGADGADPEAE